MVDPAESCCISNKVSNTLTADSAIPCDTNSGTQCANGNSDENYLNNISLEYENIERKGASLEWNWQKIFKI